MYKCDYCKCKFDEPDTLSTTYEDYYGVSDDVMSRTHLSIEVCPICGSEEISEMNLCETCKWSHIDSDSEEYCETDESYDCDDYEEI